MEDHVHVKMVPDSLGSNGHVAPAQTSSVSNGSNETPFPNGVESRKTDSANGDHYGDHFEGNGHIHHTDPAISKTDGIELVFRDLEYKVKVTKKQPKPKGRPFAKSRKEDKIILQGVSGILRPGRFCAILGASGAGKTTLLNLLAGQAKGGKASGEILLNGVDATPSLMRKVSAFVFQDDVILETQTVREALTMSAMLRLPRSISDEEKLSRVQETIDTLFLNKCSETVIGGPTLKGISGGERKRTTVGMEMITNPNILLLDEPTSGLDSFTAYSIVATLKDLAASGRTVAATLHQPSSEIFHMFDDLCLMAEGRIMYFGPSAAAVEYFAAQGFQCPTYVNPADYMFMEILNTLEVVGEGTGNGKLLGDDTGKSDSSLTRRAAEESTFRIQKLVDAWPESAMSQSLDEMVAQSKKTGIDESTYEKRATLGTQMKQLLPRAWRNALRNKLIVAAKFGQTMFMGLLLGLIYLQVTNDQNGIQNRLGSLFFILVNTFMISCMGLLSAFGPEKEVFAREYGQRMYGIFPFLGSKLAIEVPFSMFFIFIYCCITYWMIGYQANASKFAIFFLTIMLVGNTGIGLGIFLACLFADVNVALLVAPAAIMPLMIFSGFFVSNNGIPAYFSWIRWLSPINYGFAALTTNEFEGLVLTCTPQQLNAQGLCPVTSGEQVLARGNYAAGTSILVDEIVLFALSTGLIALAFLGLFRIVLKLGR